MPIISECYTRTNKNIILDSYTIPDIDTGFYRNTITNNDITFN